MLSRDAEACYWIGRYMERAESTARMVDIHYHTALEVNQPYVLSHSGSEGVNIGWQALLAISGNFNEYMRRYSRENDRDALHFFAFDEKNPDSIISTWTAAREGARSIRELISSEMWESVNVAYLELRTWDVDRMLAATPHEFFSIVKNYSYLFQGITSRTLLLGEPAEWLDLGRFLERSCQTSRILDVKYHDLLFGALNRAEQGVQQEPEGDFDPLETHRWVSVLRSVSAFEMFCKTHRDGVTPENVVSFLVLNELLPSSVRHGVGRVDGCLRRISGSDNGASLSPSRLVGRLVADLAYTSAEEIIDRGLHIFLERVVMQCNAIGDAITGAYLS
jgi:uncharacterized alpha-E superfamily protein